VAPTIIKKRLNEEKRDRERGQKASSSCSLERGTWRLPTERKMKKKRENLAWSNPEGKGKN